MTHQLESSLIRILNDSGKPVGAGFLVSNRQGVTCAHVVAAAVPEEPEGGQLKFDFPLLPSQPIMEAKVVLYEEATDIAGLELLGDLPKDARPGRLLMVDDPWGHNFRAFGFPSGYDNGVWASGRILAKEATGWLQIEDVKQTGYFVQPGFSGGPIWDEELQGVVGMVVVADTSPGIKAAFCISVRDLTKAWPILEKQSIPPCPYRGLFAFREKDAPFFFGREVFAEKLFQEVQQKPLVAVVGSSGNGKSSAVFAGLLPRLRPDPNWAILDFRPGARPFESLSQVLLTLLEPEITETDRMLETRKLAESLQCGDLRLTNVLSRLLQKCSPACRLLLIVDQFEEIYTQVPKTKAEIRTQFIDALLDTMKNTEGLRLIFTLRADFFGQVLAYRPLADTLQDSDLKLGPMNQEELRQAIEQPAALYDVAFEPFLVERLLDDVGDQPGHLPLLEFALTLLWDRQEDGFITHAAYDEIGQVEGALARYADEVFERLTPSEQEHAHRAFIQMVSPGAGTEDTRRQATRNEIDPLSWILVERMANARLVVTDQAPTGEKTAEVVHETLISNWGKLRGWMEADREFRAWQERLRAALRQWEASKQDKGALLRGLPLAESEDWLKKRQKDISESEIKYIQASLTFREQEHIARERQRNQILAGAIAVAIIMILLAAYGYLQSQEAHKQADIALSALSEAEMRGTEAAREAARANAASTQAISKQATAEAAESESRSQLALTIAHQGEALFEEEPLLGLSLALEAREVAQSSDSDVQESIIEVIYGMARQGRLLKIGNNVWGIHSNSDLSIIIIQRYQESGTLILADGEVIPLSGEIDYSGVNFSPDEAYFVVDYTDVPDELRLASGEVIPLSGEIDYSSVNFSPDEAYFVVDYSDVPDELRLASGEVIPLSDEIYGVVFSPSGSYFEVNYKDVPDELRLASGEVVPLSGEIYTVHFSPDEAYFVVDYSDAPDELRLASGEVIPLSGEISSVNFSPDETYFVVDYDDAPGEMRLASGEVIPLSGEISWVNFSPDGVYFVVDYGDAPDEIHLASGEMIPLSGEIYGVVFSPDETYFVVDYEDAPDEMRLASGEVIPLSGEIDYSGVNFSPDGAYFLVNYNDAPDEMRLASGEVIPLSGEIDYSGVNFSPDDAYFVVDYDDTPDEMRLANSEVIPLSGEIDYSGVNFSPDGVYFVVDYDDAPGEIRLASGEVIPLSDEIIEEVNFSLEGAYFVVILRNKGGQLWFYQNEAQLLTDLGSGLAVSSFAEQNQRLITGYIGGLAYLLDLEWLMAMGNDYKVLPIEDLVQLLCKGPLKSDLFDETALINYLGGLEPKACKK